MVLSRLGAAGLDHNIKFWSAKAWCPLTRTLNGHLVVGEEYDTSHVRVQMADNLEVQTASPNPNVNQVKNSKKFYGRFLFRCGERCSTLVMEAKFCKICMCINTICNISYVDIIFFTLIRSQLAQISERKSKCLARVRVIGGEAKFWTKKKSKRKIGFKNWFCRNQQMIRSCTSFESF